MIQDMVIKCGDCSLPLADVLVQDEDYLRSSFRIFNCPHCGGSSFNSKVFSGKVSLCPTNPDKWVFDVIDTDVENDIIYTKLQIRRSV